MEGNLVHHSLKENKSRTFRLETLNPTSDSVIPIRLKKVTMEDISSASAYNMKISNSVKFHLESNAFNNVLILLLPWYNFKIKQIIWASHKSLSEDNSFHDLLWGTSSLLWDSTHKKTGSSTVRREGWMNEMRALTYQRVSDP